MYHLTKKSANAKTGPIPVSTSTRETCPSACPLKNNGCYAEHGKLRMHWNKVSDGERGTALDAFADQIKALPENQLWRHNQAGDLPGTGNRINRRQLRQIVKANEGKRGFTYTHKPLTPTNITAIREANAGGFTVNVSANNPSQAADLIKTGLPVVTVLPSGSPKVTKVGDHRIVACPATQRDGVTCATCGLCARADRDYIIGFPVHGSAKRKADIIARSA